MKMYEFQLKFHESLFLGVKVNNSLALVQIMALCLPDDIYASFGLIELNLSNITATETKISTCVLGARKCHWNSPIDLYIEHIICISQMV